MSNKCLATTERGTECKNPVAVCGYCLIHYKQQRTKPRKKKWT